MSVDWGDYEPYRASVNRSLNEVSRAEAKAEYEQRMAQKELRKETLSSLLARNGVQLDGGDESLGMLSAWYLSNVELGREYWKVVEPIGRIRSVRMKPIWYSISVDMSLYLGDMLIARRPHLYWTMSTRGRRSHSYQRAVVIGFRNVQDKHYYVDWQQRIAVLGQGHLGDSPQPPDRILTIFKREEQLAG